MLSQSSTELVLFSKRFSYCPFLALSITNAILFHTVKEQKVFTKNFALLRESPGEEAIHDLRVSVKKLNAYLELYILLQKEVDPLSFCNEELLTKTNDLFDAIGRQRDVEICIELLTGLQKENEYYCPQFIFYLKTLLKKTREWSGTAIHQFRNREIPAMIAVLKQDKQFDNAKELNLKIESVINRQLPELEKCFRKPHQLRIKLKSIFYWLFLLNANEKYQPELLHQVLDYLGNWQDMEIFGKRLKHFRKDYFPKSFTEYPVLKKIEQDTKESKKSLVRKTITRTKKWAGLVMSSPGISI